MTDEKLSRNFIVCPNCGDFLNQVKCGKNKSGSQRFLCKTCGKRYTPLRSEKYDSGIKTYAKALYERDYGLRAISRVIKVPHQTIAKWINADDAILNFTDKKESD